MTVDRCFILYILFCRFSADSFLANSFSVDIFLVDKFTCLAQTSFQAVC